MKHFAFFLSLFSLKKIPFFVKKKQSLTLYPCPLVISLQYHEYRVFIVLFTTFLQIKRKRISNTKEGSQQYTVYDKKILIKKKIAPHPSGRTTIMNHHV